MYSIDKTQATHQQCMDYYKSKIIHVVYLFMIIACMVKVRILCVKLASVSDTKHQLPKIILTPNFPKTIQYIVCIYNFSQNYDRLIMYTCKSMSHAFIDGAYSGHHFHKIFCHKSASDFYIVYSYISLLIYPVTSQLATQGFSGIQFAGQGIWLYSQLIVLLIH